MGKRTGVGKITYPDGSKYDGGFKNNLKEGAGIFTFKDGSSYTGYWKNDLKDGRGAFKWADGSKFHGNFENGEIKDGILTMKDGTQMNIN